MCHVVYVVIPILGVLEPESMCVAHPEEVAEEVTINENTYIYVKYSTIYKNALSSILSNERRWRSELTYHVGHVGHVVLPILGVLEPESVCVPHPEELFPDHVCE